MTPTISQRWHSQRDSYRPAGEPICTADYDVTPIAGDNTAKAFVQAHHYSRSYPAARWRFGLYRATELVGVAVFSHPVNNKTITGNLPVSEPTDGVELGRFVLLDSVPANGETWMLGRCFEYLRREGLAGVVSMSDPSPRTTAAGHVVFGGHVGCIYQAHNAVYLGRGTARTLRILPDGSVFNDRSIQKLRKRERGWMHVAGQLVEAGAASPGPDLLAWLAEWLPRLTRPLKHSGNHKYVWGLHRVIRRMLPASLPYPKLGKEITL